MSFEWPRKPDWDEVDFKTPMDAWQEAVEARGDHATAWSANGLDYQLVGDGSEDCTTRIQAMLDSVGAAEIPSPDNAYRITEPIVFDRVGQSLSGKNPLRTIIQQTSADQDGIQVVADPTNDLSSVNFYVRLRDFWLKAVDLAGTATGVGIRAAYNPSSFNGDLMEVDRVSISGFDTGVYVRRWAMSEFRHLFIRDGRIGMDIQTNANTICIEDAAISRMSEVCLILGSANGCVLTGSEFGLSPKGILIKAGFNGVLLGGNFEQITGAEAIIDIESGARVVAIGQRFLKGGLGTELPAYRVADGASLTVISPTYTGFAATTPLVKKSATGAVVSIIGTDATLNSAIRIAESDGTLITPNVFPSRRTNAIPGAATNYRGQIIHGVLPDATAGEDRLLFGIKNRAGANEFIDLTDPKHLYASGVSWVRQDGVLHLSGRKDFTSAAAAHTDVTINVGAFTTLYGVGAIGFASGGQNVQPSLMTATTGTGDLVFRCHHPGDVGGGISLRLYYQIDVQV